MNPFKLILLPYQWKIFEDQNPFIISKISRQCGKSTTFAAKAVYKSLMNNDNLVLLVSVNQRSADELLRKVKQWAQACKIAAPNAIDYTETASSVTFNNKSRIISVPANPQALRGWSADVVLDEYALVDDDASIFQAVLPVITSKMKGEQHSLWICSTPSSLDTQFAKIWNSSDDSWHRYEFNIYDCVEQGLKADPETLRKVVDDDLIWNTEYMVQFASGAGTAFPPEWLTSISFDKVDGNKTYYLGYDVARRGDFSAFAIAFLKDNKFYIEDIIKVKDTPYNEQLQLVKKLNAKYQFRGGYTDSVGVGSMIAEEIQRTVNSHIKPFVWNSTNKTELHDQLRTIIQDQNFFVKNEFVEMVKKDFSQMRRYISSTGRIAYAAPHTPDGHADVTSAIALALQATKDNRIQATLPITYARKSAF